MEFIRNMNYLVAFNVGVCCSLRFIMSHFPNYNSLLLYCVGFYQISIMTHISIYMVTSIKIILSLLS